MHFCFIAAHTICSCFIPLAESLSKLHLAFKRGVVPIPPSYIAHLLSAYGMLLAICNSSTALIFEDVSWGRGELLRLFSPCSFVADFACHERGLSTLSSNKAQISGLPIPSVQGLYHFSMETIYNVIKLSSMLHALQDSPDIKALQATALKPSSLSDMVFTGALSVMGESISGKLGTN